MTWPTDDNLVAEDAKSLTYGKDSFSPELADAKRDVLAALKADWWPQAGRGFRAIVSNPQLDEDSLNSSVLSRLVVYRALSIHVYPKLSKKLGADGDTFSRKADHYLARYKEEWKIITSLPIYDFDADGQFTDYDRTEGGTSRRVVRA